MDVLDPVIQPYAWGSRHAIAGIQGRPAPTEGPEAELWMGAHPAAPSGLERGHQRTTLDQVIAAGPERELGVASVARFGPRLPFLLKILAPEKALSIQVHPDRAQAEAGFAAEDQRGVPRGDRTRNYVDDWPKPELLCAVTRFEALAGFRPAADAVALFGELDVPALCPVADSLRDAGDPGRGAALRTILGWPDGERAALQADLLTAVGRLASGGGPYAATCTALATIAADHPGDQGVVAALLLNHTVLEPTEALFMAAGGLHAYLRGVGVEVMASSDNVLRAGLTPKHVDVPELERLVDPAVAVPVIRPRQVADAVFAYDVPVPEFQLFRLVLAAAPVTLPAAGPRIVLCLTGDATLSTPDGGSVKLSGGESCFVSASDGPVGVNGQGVAFVSASGAA